MTKTRWALSAAVGIVCLLPTLAMAAGQVIPEGHCVANCGGSGDGSGAESRPRRGSSNRRDEAAERRAAGLQENRLGVSATHVQDWPTALAHFERALNLSPDDEIIRQNLADAREAVARRQEIQRAEREAAETGRRNAAAVNNLRRSVESFGETLTAASAAGGLDFDGGTAGGTSGGRTPGGLDFVGSDAMVVDARRAPSGLSIPLDDAITTAYSNAPVGVSDRVRKGFQAVVNRDWKVAKAWFEDALNRDPGNDGIRRLLDTLARPMTRRNFVSIAPPAGASRSIPGRTPIYMLDRGGRLSCCLMITRAKFRLT